MYWAGGLAWLGYRLDMAGVVGSNPTRPTVISTTPVDSSKLLGPLQKTEAALQFWQQFHQYLLQRMTPKTAEDRIRYAKQFGSVLPNGDGATILLQVPPNKRIHVMKALSSLARFTGQTDNWRVIREKYGLQWSTGTEKLDAFTRFFDTSKDLDTMIQWLREAMAALPSVLEVSAFLYPHRIES